MKKNIKKRNRLSKIYILIISISIIFWFLASIFMINRISFSVVTLQSSNLTPSIHLNVDDNSSFIGKFKSLDNNLGIIYIPLNPKTIKSDGVVAFSFKQEGKGEWEYQKTYDAKLFDSQSYFTFGVPILKNSQDKVYEFEIASSLDNKESLSIKSENFITGYQYSREDITSFNYGSLRFFKNKILGSITDPDFIIKSTIYLLPLFIFILLAFIINLLSSITKRISINLNYLRIVIPILLLFTLLLESNLPIDSFPILILLWISLIVSYKLRSRFTLITGFVVIVIWIVIIPLGFFALQSKLNEIAYALLFIGCIQLLAEERRNIEKKKN